MAYDFFFSYARADNGPYLQQFFADLSDEVRSLKGEKPEVAVGFLDQRDIELGEDWDGAIANALATTPVVLSLASPAYFKSDYCGRELALFARRVPQGLPNEGFPPVIKPLVWIPFKDDEVPARVSSRQFTYGDPGALLNTKGVRSLLKLRSVNEATYVPFVEGLAQQIVDAAAAHPLPMLTDVPRLRAIESWFGHDGGEPPLPDAPSPDRVRFIYVAASPTAFAGARDPAPYLRAGGGEWKPFFPDSRPIHRVMQQIVASDELQFTSDEATFGPDLVETIKQAWNRRSIVVLVVDPWSVYWDAGRAASEYLEPLRTLDQRNDYNWCVLVPWNDADAEVAARGGAIVEALQNTFPFHARLNRNPMFYRDGLATFDQLKLAISEVLVRLRDEIRRLAPVSMPIPAGPSKTVVSGARR